MSSLQQFASIDSSCRLAYSARGDAEGVAVIFLPGFSDSWLSYEPLLDAMPTSYRLIAISQLGHGDSDKPDDGYSVACFADDLAGFMNSLGIARAIIVGHSFGSMVATRFALKYPDRVHGLCLIGAFRTVAGHPGAEEIWTNAIEPMTDTVDPSFVREFQLSTLARPIPPARLVSAIAESQKMPARVWRALWRSMLDDDFSMQLTSIDAPTLIVWGRQDAFNTPDEQMKLHSAIRDSELVAIAEAGHAPHWEDPAGVAEILENFFELALAHRNPQSLALPSINASRQVGPVSSIDNILQADHRVAKGRLVATRA
jgi:non-heme chloroperoxidase